MGWMMFQKISLDQLLTEPVLLGMKFPMFSPLHFSWTKLQLGCGMPAVLAQLLYSSHWMVWL